MSRRFSFGEFVLDRDTRELRREHHVVSMSPKAFQLLEILLENQPKAMAKGMLQDLLWPNTFVVEKNLANLVGEIREALGDSAGNPRFVRTVPRFGYAFREAPAITAGQGAGAWLGPIPQCRLTWSAGRAALCDGDHIVGRDADAELFLDSPSVSRRHALIRVSGSQATLEDLGSKNGTFVGSRRIDAPTPLADGDAIQVGAFTLTFEVIHAHGVTETW
jgi:DNA-binding winged helix-turn-helix (wHTH) protein